MMPYLNLSPMRYFNIPQNIYRKKLKDRKEEEPSKKSIKFDFKKLIPLIILLILMITFKQFRKVILYVIFIAITGYITYYSKLYNLPIDVSPLFFLQIVITRYYGLKYTLLYILIAYFGPKIMAGHAANWTSYAFVTVSILCNIISLFMTDLSLQLVGYITSVIQYIGGIPIVMTMMPFYFAAGDGIANVTNNLIWFLIFSDLIVFLF